MQSDDFFGLLQELSKDVKLEHPQAQAASPVSPRVCGGGGEAQQSGVSSTTAPVVGLSSAELESLNELIQIDHVYVKPQPAAASSRQGGKSAQQQQQKIVMPASPKKTASVATIVSPNSAISSSSKITCLPSPKLQEIKPNVLMPGVKRQHNGQLVVALEPSPVSTSTHTSPVHTVGIQATKVEGPAAIDSDYLFSGAAEDSFDGSLADPDMDTSLNFLNDFGMDFLVTNQQQLNFDLAADTDNCGDSSVPDPSFLKVEDVGCASPPASELNPIKLFDEIYEHYLNIKDAPKTDSPIPSVHSDSGVGSDVEPLSPLSNGESLNGDYLWQDLFPDLQ